MNRARGSWWWAQITRILVYLALGIVSVCLSILTGARYPAMVIILTWILAVSLIDIQIQSETVEEEDP